MHVIPEHLTGMVDALAGAQNTAPRPRSAILSPLLKSTSLMGGLVQQTFIRHAAHSG